MESPLSHCSPPATPPPESHQNSPGPVAPPLSLGSPKPPKPLSPRTKLGSLDLKPCSLEEYFQIEPSVYGKYEYVDGILVAVPMADENHDNIVKYLYNETIVRYCDGHNTHLPGTQEGLAIPNSPSSSKNPEAKKTVRRPDVTFGRSLLPSERNELSPRSKKVSNAVKGQVESAVEVTSHNEKTDTKVKPHEYEKAGVKMYAIVNRDVTCKDESKRDQRVIVYRRNSLSEPFGSEETYRGEEEVDLGPHGTHKPSTLFSRPDPGAPIKQMVERNEKKAEKAKQTEQELRAKNEEDAKKARKREQELRAKNEEDARKAKRREQELRAKNEEDAKKARKREQQLRAKNEEDAKKAKRREQELRAKNEEDAKKAKKREQELQDKLKEAKTKKRHYKRVVRKKVPDEEASSSSGSPRSRTNSPDSKRAKGRRNYD